MMLSIIIPVYNTEKYIYNCLKSIYQQSFDFDFDFEIIIINDGSKDNSELEIKKFIADYTLINIHYFKQENQGVSSARNKGIEMAKGHYIWFIDSDDTIEQTSGKIISKYLNLFPNHTLVFNYNRVINNQVLRNKMPIEETHLCLKNHEFIGKITSYLWNVLYQTEFIKKYNIRFIDGTINIEDYHFNMQYFFSSFNLNIIFINEVIYNYYLNSSSTSQNKNPKHLLKLADDSLLIHSEIDKKYQLLLTEKRLKEAYSLKKELSHSVMGFFYSLLRFYDIEACQLYYNKYKKENLIPIELNSTGLKKSLFSFIINNKTLFLLLKKYVKFK